ncbi:MAG TPA: tyrosine-type recombinase/integrase [Pseudolabrys sp.]|nr:tyrosine-type recombinase/integrase [Pseudolabrys sp.]
MRTTGHSDLILFGHAGSRKYLNAPERSRFLSAAKRAPPEVRLFCLTLCLSGGRISEVLALTPAAIDLDAGAANLTTLKRRKRGLVRQIPLPRDLLDELDGVFGLRDRQRRPSEAHRRLWRWSRSTAWRRVKETMALADITGLAATPKGLRHAFGVNAFQSLVPPHLVQRWLGHASLRTTAIYGDVLGPDERAFAARMWGGSNLISRVARLFRTLNNFFGRRLRGR